MKEIVFILDMSGSMYPQMEDVVCSFNRMIEEHRNEEALVTTVLFNTKHYVVHDRLPIAEVPPLTEEDYKPRGCTALVDAIGCTIKHIADIHKYIRPEDVPEETKFFIFTDGAENSSHLYTSNEVRHCIKHRQNDIGWKFNFIAENIDAKETASLFGIDRDNASSVENIDEAFNIIGKTL